MSVLLLADDRAAGGQVMPIEILTPPSREAWLRLRGKTIGGSEVAALVGAHPFTSRYELWSLKSGVLKADPTETGPMRRGRHLEAVAVEFLREERPTWTVTANPIPGGQFYRSLDLGLSCTPDAFVEDPARPGERGICQIKSVEPSVFRKKWKTEDGAIEPPLYVVLQAIQEAYLTGATWAVVCPLVIGFSIEMPIIEVPIHHGVIDRIKSEVADFWRSVERGVAPDPDYAKDGAAIAAIFPDDNGTEIDLQTDNHLPELLADRDRLKSEIKVAETAVTLIDTEFKHRLGPHQAALLAGGRRVTWKSQHRRGYSVEPADFRVLRFNSAR